LWSCRFHSDPACCSCSSSSSCSYDRTDITIQRQFLGVLLVTVRYLCSIFALCSLRDVVLCCVALRCVALCDIVFCGDLFCFVVIWFGLWCSVVLCSVVLCCDVM